MDSVARDPAAPAAAIDYAALERASNTKNNDPRSDLFFVGVILYNMIAGTSPIGDHKDRISRLSSTRFHNIKPIQVLEPTIPGRLAAFIMRSRCSLARMDAAEMQGSSASPPTMARAVHGHLGRRLPSTRIIAGTQP